MRVCFCREETGACYAIDIGGTNFRVVYYKLSEKRGVIVSSSGGSSSRVHQH
jgi:hexokinase